MGGLSYKRSCFVVMPFGEKQDLDGQSIDFNDVYEFFFKRTIESLKEKIPRLDITCIRCDEIDESGSIHKLMIEHIYRSDIVVVDITTANANVYYELGIRHALAKGVTILIRRKGTIIPFNIQGLQVVEYDQSRFKSIEAARNRISEIINGSLRERTTDSPVHLALDLNIEPEAKRLGDVMYFEAPLRRAPRRCIGLVTGDVKNVTRGIDVWVNVENTYMQMARIFDNSISGIIRYFGGRDEKGDFKDTIARELAARLDRRTSIGPAEVLVTTSGGMRNSHNVRWIFHTAANIGQVGNGYTPIPEMSSCVVNALREGRNAEVEARSAADGPLESILFPLMGTTSRRGGLLKERIKDLLDAAVDYLSDHPECAFRKVYFLTYTDREFDACRDILADDKRLDDLREVGQTSADGTADPTVSQGAGTRPTGLQFDRSPSVGANGSGRPDPGRPGRRQAPAGAAAKAGKPPSEAEAGSRNRLGRPPKPPHGPSAR